MFVRGCPWRCGYCHNPHLQHRRGADALAWPAVEAELRRRVGWLDGVVFSGGEPSTDPALPDAVSRVRGLGHRVGLHTCGAFPDRLRGLLPMLDWVGFDIKAGAGGYDALTTVEGSGDAATRSARMVVDSGVAHEFRLTYHGGLLTEASVIDAADRLARWGVGAFVLQEFRADGVAGALPPHLGVGAGLLEELASRFDAFTFRSADGGAGAVASAAQVPPEPLPPGQ